MKTGNIVTAPPHFLTEDPNAQFLEVYPTTMKDMREMQQIPVTKRTYCETLTDEPRTGQSPRLVLVEEAYRMGWI